MKKRWSRLWIGLVMSLVLVVMAGCQAIGGVDLNKALLSLVDVKSMEGSGSVTIELQLDKTMESGLFGLEDMALLQSLSPMKLNLDHMKMENPSKMSVKGSLELRKGKIPFQASITPEELAILPEGASVPWVIQTADLSELEGAEGEALQELQKKLENPDFLKPIYSFLFNSMPNPKNIKVDTVTETIYGESVSLFKVDSSLNGKELLPWVKSFLLAMMKDDAGLKEVSAHLYDNLKPTMDVLLDSIFSEPAYSSFDQEAMEAYSELEDDEEWEDEEWEEDYGFASSYGDAFGEMFLSSFKSMMEDREVAIEVLHTEMKQGMVILLALLNGPDVDSFIDANSTFKNSLYVDSSMKVRKSTTDILIPVPSDLELPGVKSVKISSEFSNWNVNKEVKADMLATEDALILDDNVDGRVMLQELDSSSLLYQWMKDDLKASRKTASFWLMSNEYLPPSMQTYNVNGLTMVPARYLAESLGAEVEWEASTQTVTIYDSWSDSLITIKVGSSTASVNGSTIKLGQPAAIKNGTVYVPLRAVAEALGGEVEWDPELRIITVTTE